MYYNSDGFESSEYLVILLGYPPLFRCVKEVYRATLTMQESYFGFDEVSQMIMTNIVHSHICSIVIMIRLNDMRVAVAPAKLFKPPWMMQHCIERKRKIDILRLWDAYCKVFLHDDHHGSM